MPVSTRGLDYRVLNFLLAAVGGAVAVYVAVAVPPPHTPGSPLAVPLGSDSPTPIVVYVSGAVRTPGLYHLPPEARLDSALQAAGGLLPQASSTTLNLARRVKDEEMIVVDSQADPSPHGLPASPTPTGALDINQSDASQLEDGGLSAAQARHVVEWREAHGPIHSAEELRTVPGLSRSWRKVAQACGLDPGPEPAHHARKRRRRKKAS